MQHILALNTIGLGTDKHFNEYVFKMILINEPIHISGDEKLKNMM